MTIQLIVIFLLATAITYHSNYRWWEEQMVLFLAVFAAYCLLTVVSHSYVANPYTDYFISSDQVTFYGYSAGLKNLPIDEIFRRSFSDYRFSEMPLIIFYFSLLMKWAQSLDVADLLLFVKINTAFLAALVPVYMYKMLRLYVEDEGIRWPLLAFALLCPIFFLSCQMMRDVHVTLVYTIGAYIVMNEEASRRLPKLLLLLVVAYFLRMENGLFFMLFIALQQYDEFRRRSPLGKMLMCAAFIALLAVLLVPTLDVMQHTQEGYAQRSQLAADAGSLGVAVQRLPFPLNSVGMFVLSQLLPFPIWKLSWAAADYGWLSIIERLMPFYWLPIVLALFVNMWKHWREIDIKLRLFFIVALLFNLMIALAEINLRRQLAVYPIFVVLMMLLHSQWNFSMRRYWIDGFALLAVLHIAYIMIK